MTKRPIYFDIETTGVKSDSDRIVEIAAYDPVNNTSFSKLIHPECVIPEEVIRIHHITNEMVENSPPFKEIAQEFLDFCGEDAIIIAHNGDGFDKPFLEAEYKRCGMILTPHPWVDTLKWARKYRKDLPRHSLQFLRELFEIEQNNAHRALDDVMILYQVSLELWDNLPIETVLKLLYQPKDLIHMPFGKHQGVPLKEVPKSYYAWLKTSGAFDKSENQDLKNALEKLGLISV